MRDILNFIRELLLLKEEKNSTVGLSSLKKTQKPALKKAKSKIHKELILSDLMRRA